jgi:hypothetical protein
VQNVKFVGDVGTLYCEPGDPCLRSELYAENVANTDNTSGHGTHVAAAAGGTGAGSRGKYKGVAPGAKLVGLGVGDGLSIVNVMVLGAVDWLIDNKAKYNVKVVNNSWGGRGTFDPNDPDQRGDARPARRRDHRGVRRRERRPRPEHDEPPQRRAVGDQRRRRLQVRRLRPEQLAVAVQRRALAAAGRLLVARHPGRPAAAPRHHGAGRADRVGALVHGIRAQRPRRAERRAVVRHPGGVRRRLHLRERHLDGGAARGRRDRADGGGVEGGADAGPGARRPPLDGDGDARLRRVGGRRRLRRRARGGEEGRR